MIQLKNTPVSRSLVRIIYLDISLIFYLTKKYIYNEKNKEENQMKMLNLKYK